MAFAAGSEARRRWTHHSEPYWKWRLARSTLFSAHLTLPPRLMMPTLKAGSGSITEMLHVAGCCGAARAEPLAYISAAAEAYFVFERMLVTSSANALCILVQHNAARARASSVTPRTSDFRLPTSKQEACFCLLGGGPNRPLIGKR